ncbi:head-tail adaptor protein [Paracoccus sediminis]|jgi:head-tail adaptor|uniref:Head-tail adaptor n=1 Tax=Paracoccus sediminis TaxID=1214787 RepID=A0A238XJE2_9RHOB|nr:head-tail adaptor protein [Paracoccus sediminis]TBN48539.1 head-tail adaptor protein [Paracoccus sediminis]SNR58701.1 head-tail adaptor [Paracoccus sediminis]
MSGPKLGVRLDLERSVRQQDGMGGYRIVWQPIGALWAEMRAGSGQERGAEVGPESVVSWRITVRGAKVGDLRRPVAGQRLRMGRRLFAIEAVAERDVTGRWLTCFAREEEQT